MLWHWVCPPARVQLQIQKLEKLGRLLQGANKTAQWEQISVKIGSFSESEANLSTLHICKIDKIWQRQTREEEEDEVLKAGVKKRHWYTISNQFQYIRHITQCIVDLGAVSGFDGVVNAGGGGGGGGGRGGMNKCESEVIPFSNVGSSPQDFYPYCHHHWEHPLNLFSLALWRVSGKQMNM